MFKKSSDSNSLAERSKSILSVFNSTIEKLSTLASEAKEQSAIKLEESRLAALEAQALQNIAADNEAYAKKIKDLITPDVCKDLS